MPSRVITRPLIHLLESAVNLGRAAIVGPILGAMLGWKGVLIGAAVDLFCRFALASLADIRKLWP
jgi:hypothetical protein